MMRLRRLLCRVLGHHVTWDDYVRYALARWPDDYVRYAVARWPDGQAEIVCRRCGEVLAW